MKGIKKEHMRSASVGVSVVLLLAVYAVAAPRWVMEQTNRRTLEQTDTFSFSIAAYQNSYADFGEELEAMAQADAWEGVYLMGLLADREVDELTREQVTESLNRELSLLTGQGLLSQSAAMETGALEFCELFSLYAKEEENPLNGILFWHLIYVDEATGVESEFVLEGTFRKICFLRMHGTQVSEPDAALQAKQRHSFLTRVISAYYEAGGHDLLVWGRNDIYDAYGRPYGVSDGVSHAYEGSAEVGTRDGGAALSSSAEALPVCYEWQPLHRYLEFGIWPIYKIMWM